MSVSRYTTINLLPLQNVKMHKTPLLTLVAFAVVIEMADTLTVLKERELEQLERLRSEDTPCRLMITHTQILEFCHKLNTRHTL